MYTVCPPPFVSLIFFFFNDTATTEIYTLSLHDALPISRRRRGRPAAPRGGDSRGGGGPRRLGGAALELEAVRSEKETSEIQSTCNIVFRLLLEKKKTHIPPYALLHADLCLSRYYVHLTL